MKQACVELQPDGYKPGITFISVNTKHETRFFPKNEADGVGSSKNVPPGTCVDSTVCHPTAFDFYISSHKGIQVISLLYFFW